MNEDGIKHLFQKVIEEKKLDKETAQKILNQILTILFQKRKE